MGRRTEALLALTLVAGCARREASVETVVGHHRVRFVLPKGCEHLDHGREQLFRFGEAQLTLVDLGPVTGDAMSRELERAREVWLAGRRRDAFARVDELRSPQLAYATSEQRAEFWRPWSEVGYSPAVADSAGIGAAFDALTAHAHALAPATPERLYQYVADRVLTAHGQEIAAQERRTIRGRTWMVYDLWNRVSHGARTRVAFTDDDGCLLALAMDLGPPERLAPAFEALLASLEVEPIS